MKLSCPIEASSQKDMSLILTADQALLAAYVLILIAWWSRDHRQRETHSPPF